MNIERTEFIAWMERIMERFDILKEQADGQAENEDERFDLDFTLMTGEVARLLDDLLEALGGEVVPQS